MPKTNLDKFLQAQKRDYPTALREISSGRKQTHWIWYIFPQLKALGRSETAKHYGIKDLAEAREYLANDTLRKHLIEISQALLDLPKVPGVGIRDIMGFPDDLKLCSSMTLFYLAEPKYEVFKQVLDRYFHGVPDKATVKICKNASEN